MSGTDDGAIREMWFEPNAPGSGYNTWTAAQIGARINGLTVQYTTTDGTQHVISGGASGRLGETWFRPGTVNRWDIPALTASGHAEALGS